MHFLLGYPNILIIFLIFLWFLSVLILYRNSQPKELNHTGLHFEFAAIAVLSLLLIDSIINNVFVNEELLFIAPIVIGRFFAASEVIQKHKG